MFPGEDRKDGGENVTETSTAVASHSLVPSILHVMHTAALHLSGTGRVTWKAKVKQAKMPWLMWLKMKSELMVSN